MTLLFRVLHAVHARGTHHKLALDALAGLGGPQADAWQRVFLKNVDKYLAGAKAPDDEFKDFTNHVLHPRDNWWGGAPHAARDWYEKLVDALRDGDWEAASYRAGVLTHYVSDPLQPFHTGQSEAESNIHRAFEWSISNSYAALMKIAGAEPRPALVVPAGDNWLEALIATGADDANNHYEKLLAHFDIHRSVVDPASGLDVVAKRIIAVQLDRASKTLSAVLDRALAEANVAPPDVALGLATLLAIIKVPVKMWAKRLENAEDRRLVEKIYDELKATGTVEKNLPEDERVVRDRHAAEVLAKRPAVVPASEFPARPKDKVDEALSRPERARAVAVKPVPGHAAKVAPPPVEATQPEALIDEPARPAPVAADARAPLEPLVRRKLSDVLAAQASAEAQAILPSPANSASVAAPVQLEPVAVSTPRAPIEATTGGARIYLTGAQPVVDAPSIGPKMAERLAVAGITTVDDLLNFDPEALAAKLGARDIDGETVREWQDQTRLVCTIPGLRGTHAQLLVGAGFRDAAAIAATSGDELSARVLAFAATPAGHRVLRNGDPPDIERIKTWGDSARSVRAA